MADTTPDDRTKVVDQLMGFFAEQGAGMYAGEVVTQLQHALQAATLAEQGGCPDELVVAALLHDMGHLLHDHGEDCAQSGIDDEHESAGAEWLAQFFPAAVVEPIRLHVDAKRYRCAIDRTYHDRLSHASRLSLKLQGGPMSPEEASGFRANPHSAMALKLRAFDEAAKDPDMKTPDLEHFRDTILRTLDSGTPPEVTH